MTDFVHHLKHDHHVIQQVVAGMIAIADVLDAGKQVDPAALADLVQFFSIFAGRCHHEKEEQYLFPLLATKASANTIRDLDTLEQEHRSAAHLVEELGKVSVAYAQNPPVMRYRVVALLRRLVEVYPAHIWKEDYLLFPMAQQTLSAGEQEHLEDNFENVELEVGEDVHAAFETLAKRLEAVVEYRNSGSCPLCSAVA